MHVVGRVLSLRWAYGLLRVLADGEVSYTGAVASMREQSPDCGESIVTRTLNSLQKYGLVQHCAAGKGSQYRLTPIGQAFVADLVPSVENWLDRNRDFAA